MRVPIQGLPRKPQKRIRFVYILSARAVHALRKSRSESAFPRPGATGSARRQRNTWDACESALCMYPAAYADLVCPAEGMNDGMNYGPTGLPPGSGLW